MKARRRRILLIVMKVTLFCAGLNPAPLRAAANPESTGAVRIRVRLGEAVPGVSVRGYDLRIRAGSARAVAAQSDRSAEWSLSCQDGRIRAVEAGGARALTLAEPVIVDSPAGFLTYATRSYRDTLTVHTTGSFCEVVNEVDLERYLEGVVNSEFSSKWSEEAALAQVVAARTYALYQIRQAATRPGSRFDVEAGTRDQVYDGSVKEDWRASRLVSRSRGQVLLARADGRGPAGLFPLKAFYHSTCGGETELPEKVWGASFAGFKRRVRCPYCARSPIFRWQAELSAAEVTRAVIKGARGDGAQSGWPKDWESLLQGHLTRLKASETDAEGRVGRVWLRFEKGARAAELPVASARFRDWLGNSRLRSTVFSLTQAAGGRFRFDGRGHGHGVGMCQWGAKIMGERGFKMAQILAHYYPDAVLKRLW